MVIGWWKLPTVPGHDVPRPNPWAALMVTGGIGALTFAIVKVNDWGWQSLGIQVSFAASIACWRCSSGTACAPANPFVDPALFRVRPFTGAALVMAPYSIAFGATLFSVAVWEQTAWGWSALKAGLAIAPGPLLVPMTSLLLAGRLIARFGVARSSPPAFSSSRRPDRLGSVHRRRAERRWSCRRHDAPASASG